MAGRAPTTTRIVEMPFLKPGAQQPITVVLPDSGAGRPGAGLRPGTNFRVHEYAKGRLILAETVCASGIHLAAIFEKTRNRVCRVRRAPPLANLRNREAKRSRGERWDLV